MLLASRIKASRARSLQTCRLSSARNEAVANLLLMLVALKAVLVEFQPFCLSEAVIARTPRHILDEGDFLRAVGADHSATATAVVSAVE